MAIAVQLDEIMEDRGVSLQKLSHCVGITNVNLSRIKTGKVRSMRFSKRYAKPWNASQETY